MSNRNSSPSNSPKDKVYLRSGMNTRSQWIPTLRRLKKYLIKLVVILFIAFNLLGGINLYFNVIQIKTICENSDYFDSQIVLKITEEDNDWTSIVLNDGEDPNPDVREKRDFIKEMTREAWISYKTYAWSDNELNPITKSGYSQEIFGNSKMGATIVDGLDTLWIMGLKDEFNEGRDWIEHNLNFDGLNTEVSVFETTIRFVGGLLSCYALTKDNIFLLKANSIAGKMLPAFNTPTGIPYSVINLLTGGQSFMTWLFQSGFNTLAGVGTLHMEFLYLSDITGIKVYKEKVFNVRRILNSLYKPRDLYPSYVNPRTGQFIGSHYTMGGLGDSFYEYLLKSWIQSGGNDVEARDMWDKAIEAIEKNLIKNSTSGLTYVAVMKNNEIIHSMGHLACFASGLIALSGQSLPQKRREHYLQLGAQIARTCHESYDRSDTKLGPESFQFNDEVEAKAESLGESRYILRPEAIEGWFYMWRLTHDNKYRDWAWSAAQAIHTYCRTDNGYSGIENVYDISSGKDNVQQSFLLAETFKYLYLIFSTDDLISLEEWVFNTEAHPLPIYGKNPAYSQKLSYN